MRWRRELPILEISKKEDLNNWIVGSDKDIGGFSSAQLELSPEGKGRFHGHLSLELPEQLDIKKSGYAGLRSKNPPSTLWGAQYWDTTPFRYLAVRVKGDHRKYFVNLQTDGYVKTDLFQHRLFLKKPGEWETVMIPFRDFILTNNGIIQNRQVNMYREKVKNFGFSIIDRQEGPFSLEIDWIKAMNTEDTDGDVDI
ncbi:NADH:ubiquinone oxidoreductase complex I intermediate-associated protein 30 [Basidiobolus meristosporus CBS 931.73]|uniref:NADH:ubiquinone oxidoreductase complex I intermediate-associated protein 30 n=1 Tax=Basidiobolus meristosporus CBS 931.73 TaxID=1314790 RepID=A0A1Y1YCB6_9FUNG|nr:NADH:ubiquinone oxidoreductase complex I intermediate-associated protein 30 [Basidiobolus meristosporus CBS 931.73]|eukprot:ORX95575.1 NADH:ubiquinone oxidoreductase complex I intermediate-associated protein 30 [Basidiobolus meristosporus CBS 931.73]